MKTFTEHLVEMLESYDEAPTTYKLLDAEGKARKMVAYALRNGEYIVNLHYEGERVVRVSAEEYAGELWDLAIGAQPSIANELKKLIGRDRR